MFTFWLIGFVLVNLIAWFIPKFLSRDEDEDLSNGDALKIRIVGFGLSLIPLINVVALLLVAVLASVAFIEESEWANRPYGTKRQKEVALPTIKKVDVDEEEDE